MLTEFKYLKFTNERLSASRKTKMWDVINLAGIRLGSIYFHNQWRTYVFVTDSTCSPIFDSKCLGEIQNFLFQAITEWKANLEQKDVTMQDLRNNL